MKTIEEILESLKENPKTTNEVIWIDADSRKVDIPQKEKIFGVVGDGNAERKYLACKRKPSEDFDFKDAKIKIYHKSVAEDETEHSDIYLVNEKIYNDDYVVFSWLLTESVFPYEGNLYFFVRAEIEEENRIWQTCITAGYINENFDITLTEPEEIMIRDFVKEMIKELEDKGDYVLSRIPSDYIKLAEHHDIETQTELDAIIKAIFGESVAGPDGKTLNYAELVTIMNKFMRDEIRGNEVKIGGLLRLVNGDIIYTEEKSIDYAINSVCNYILDKISESGGYKLPMATGRFLGGVKAYEKYEDDTQPVHVDEDGFLWTNKAAVKMANDGALGGVKASQVVRGDSQPVHIDENGFLWTKPGAVSPSGNLPFYNATDYGVSPSNADNTALLQSLIDTVYTNGGGTIILPAGVINTKPILVKGKVSIYGQGMLATCLNAIGTDQSLYGLITLSENVTGITLKEFCLKGNNTLQDGIHWMPQDHEDGRDNLDYHWNHNPETGERIKYKMSLVSHVAITGFGNWYAWGETGGRDLEFNHFAVAQCVKSSSSGITTGNATYGVEYAGCWIYRNENGFNIASSDGYIHDCTIEGNAFTGYYNWGGNWKMVNCKIIWNGYGAKAGLDNMYAFIGKAQSENNPNGGRGQLMNVEFQDNQVNDFLLEGQNHIVDILIDNGAQEWRKTCRARLECSYSQVKINFSRYKLSSDNYADGFQTPVLVKGETGHHNDFRFTAHPNGYKTFGTCANANGINNIITGNEQ